MKKIFLLSFTIFFCISCGYVGKKGTLHNDAITRYITYTINKNGYNSAFTEDGHTLIYKKDSLGLYIVFYAKFDNNENKFGYDIAKEKVVRIELDSSLCSIISYLSIKGGLFFEEVDENMYNVLCINKQNVRKEIKNIRLTKMETPSVEEGDCYKIKKIISLLSSIYEATSSNHEWQTYFSALEPISSITSYEMVEGDTIYPPLIKQHLMKMNKTTIGLTQLYSLLNEKMLSSHCIERNK